MGHSIELDLCNESYRDSKFAARHETRGGKVTGWRKNKSAPENAIIAPPCQGPSRIFVADNREIARVGLRALLKRERDLNVVGEADKRDCLLIEVRRTKPDVILLKSGLSDCSDAEICQMLRDNCPAIRIIVVIWSNDESLFRHAVESGAHGILVGNICRETLTQSIRTVARERGYLGRDGVDTTFRWLRQRQDVIRPCSVWQTLSPQEQRIITRIVHGQTNKEIASNLGLSEKTVKNYIANIFAKLEITRRTQVVALYFKSPSLYQSVRKSPAPLESP